MLTANVVGRIFYTIKNVCFEIKSMKKKYNIFEKTNVERKGIHGI